MYGRQVNRRPSLVLCLYSAKPRSSLLSVAADTLDSACVAILSAALGQSYITHALVLQYSNRSVRCAGAKRISGHAPLRHTSLVLDTSHATSNAPIRVKYTFWVIMISWPSPPFRLAWSLSSFSLPLPRPSRCSPLYSRSSSSSAAPTRRLTRPPTSRPMLQLSQSKDRQGPTSAGPAPTRPRTVRMPTVSARYARKERKEEMLRQLDDF